MGYTMTWREKVLKSTMIGYMRILDRVKKGEVKRHRKGKETLVTRSFKKLLGQQEWVRVKKETPDAWE